MINQETLDKYYTYLDGLINSYIDLSETIQQRFQTIEVADNLIQSAPKEYRKVLTRYFDYERLTRNGRKTNYSGLVQIIQE